MERHRALRTKTEDVMARLSEERLWSRMEEMSKIGRRGQTGVDRQAFSDEDVAARRQLVAWGRQLGLAASTDAIANLFLRYSPAGVTGEPVMTGSHLDSQPTGGRFDGVYGVLAALEALEAINDSGVSLSRPIELVCWSNEEGSRFAPGAMGSGVFAGRRTLTDFSGLRGAAGVELSTALAATLEGQGSLPVRLDAAPPYAYLEAHVEQGPVLEGAGVQIGVVTGIQGCRWFEVHVEGEARHAGTTPASSRRDAVRGAARIITALYDEMDDLEERTRFTVGRIEAVPGSPNTIAGRVTFTIDLRHPDDARLDDLARAIRDALRCFAGTLETTIESTFEHPAVDFDPGLVGIIETAAGATGASCVRMVSGAFHDAMFMADCCPTAMIFIPSRAGVSHHPDEFSSPADLITGARVLARALVEVAA